MRAYWAKKRPLGQNKRNNSRKCSAPASGSVWRDGERERKSSAERRPWEEVVMFKAIILCALCNLSDDQVEYQILDRLSFMRFPGPCLTGRVPDVRTVWLCGNKLARAGVTEEFVRGF